LTRIGLRAKENSLLQNRTRQSCRIKAHPSKGIAEMAHRTPESPPLVALVGKSPVPPGKLGDAGQALWDAIHSAYHITDRGGIELLMQAAVVADRAAQLAAEIERDGVAAKAGLVKLEIACRAFISKQMRELGLNIENVRPIGRPPRWS
jgi:hypothetical protein